LASAQSIPTKAANVSGDVCVMRHLLEWVRSGAKGHAR